MNNEEYFQSDHYPSYQTIPHITLQAPEEEKKSIQRQLQGRIQSPLLAHYNQEQTDPSRREVWIRSSHKISLEQYRHAQPQEPRAQYFKPSPNFQSTTERLLSDRSINNEKAPPTSLSQLKATPINHIREVEGEAS